MSDSAPEPSRDLKDEVVQFLCSPPGAGAVFLRVVVRPQWALNLVSGRHEHFVSSPSRSNLKFYMIFSKSNLGMIGD